MSTRQRKLPHEFYTEVLGSPKYVMAPMVEGSDLPYRLLAKRYNTDLVYTPMLYSGLFASSKTYRAHSFQTVPEERPLIVQFAGTEPEEFLKAALFVQDRCDAIDINMGCPQRCARSGGYGAFLMDNQEKIFSIVRCLHENLDIPVFCKIRIYPDDDKTVEFAKGLEAAGCQCLVVHGRTREQKGEKSGPANWDIIKRIKETLTIPVIANGGLVDFEHIDRCLEYTGCDGVMSACSMLDNPCFFAKIKPNKFDIVIEYLEICRQHPIKPRFIRQHVFGILKDEFHHAPEFRGTYAQASRDIDESVKVIQQFRAFIESQPEGSVVPVNGEIKIEDDEEEEVFELDANFDSK